MDHECQMFLLVRGDRHRLKEGITLIGSTENDRYSVIRLQDKSICPKHAAIRCSQKTQELHVMDMCSHEGVLLDDAKRIQPLEWHKAVNSKKIHFGSVECRLEISTGVRKSNGSSASFFADEDSTDFIDCSLEEAPQTKSKSDPKKLQQSGSCSLDAIQERNVSSSSVKDASVRRDSSFFIPATQQIGDGPPSAAATENSAALQVNETRDGARATEDEDDDDMFYIPETQDCNEQADESEIIEKIGSTLGKGDKEDDYLRFETDDDENTGDGMFNNPYVEQSQNLLHNLDESHKKDAQEVPRKSIIPDRSVDSISFLGKVGPEEETDEDLSKIEWNETKNTSKATTVTDVSKGREGSVTPELVFDRPTAVQNPMLDTEEPRVDSATPDLDFDRITPQMTETANAGKLSLRKESIGVETNEPVVVVADQERAQSVTPDLDIDENKEEDEAEISLNQEGAGNRSKSDQLDPYDSATQPMAVDECNEQEPDDPYLAATQALTIEPVGLVASTSAYDLDTQMEPVVTGKESPTFKVPSIPAYEQLTQIMPCSEIKSARTLRKVAVKLTDLKTAKADVSLRLNKEIDLDPFEIATQPLVAEKPDDIYDLQTQALPVQPPDDEDDDTLDDTVPFDLPAPVTSPVVEIYDLQTQPLAAKGSHSSLEDEDSEMSKYFRPPVNSTCRQSMLAKQITEHERDEEQDKEELNISPSSNKENRVECTKQGKTKSISGKLKDSSLTQESADLLGFSQPTDEGLDEDYCLASTMPIGDGSSSKNNSTEPSIARRKGKTGRKVNEPFKVPSSATSSNNSHETPRSKAGSSNAGTTDTFSFDFNTPEHPFLDLAKKDKILAVSDMIKSRAKPTESVMRKNKYMFGDSSEEDDEPNAPVFRKADSKIQVMKYDKGEEKAATVKLETIVPERRSTRDKKKNSRYSDDEEEDSKSVASSRSGRSAGKAKVQSTTSTKSKVDESVDYQPGTSVDKSSRTRKRKANEEQPSSELEASAVASKTRKPKKENEVVTEPEAGPSKLEDKSVSKRAGARLRGAVTSELPMESKPSKTINKTAPAVVAASSGEKKTVRSTRGQSKRTVTSTTSIEPSSDEDDELTASSATDGASTSAASGSESSGTRKSSRAGKTRLMFTKMSPEPYKGIITRAGGIIVDMPELASVLVSDRVYRTYKFLCALAKGIPIVGQPYLEAVETKRDFVDPWAHILQDHEMERRFKFSLKKSLTMAREAKLFQDYSVYVTASVKPPPEELQLIVASAGGRVIKFPNQQPKHEKKAFVVSVEKDKDTWPRFRERHPEIEIISTEGFMLSIMQHYKNFRSYRLT